MNDLFKALNYVSPVALIIGLTVGLYYYKLLRPIYKSIFWYLLIMLFVDIFSRIYGKLMGTNLIVLLFYSLIELIILTYFYNKFMYSSMHKSTVGVAIIGLLYIICEIFTLHNIKVSQFQSYAKVVDNFIVIILSLVFFHEKINRYRDAKWTNFGLNMAILAFFSINMIFFLPINFLLNETAGFSHFFWFGNLFATVLFYLFLTWSIWKNGRTQRS